jgi:hypothetical protein
MTGTVRSCIGSRVLHIVPAFVIFEHGGC